MNTRVSTRTGIYAKVELSHPDTIYFHQAMKEDDATKFLKAEHKEFEDFLNKGILKWYLAKEFLREKHVYLKYGP